MALAEVTRQAGDGGGFEARPSCVVCAQEPPRPDLQPSQPQRGSGLRNQVQLKQQIVRAARRAALPQETETDALAQVRGVLRKPAVSRLSERNQAVASGIP